MKKIISIALLVAIIFALTGCMNATYHVTLKDNGKADIEYEVKMDKETMSMLSGEGSSDPFAEKKETAKANGYEVTVIDTENETGYSAKIKNVEFKAEDIAQNIGLGGSSTGNIEVDRGFFKNVYTVNLNIDTTDVFGEDSQSQSVVPYINDSINLKLLITAPGEITSQGGTAVEGTANTYEYKINLGQDNAVSLTYTTKNSSNLVICCVACVVILLAIAILAYVLIKKKSSKAKEEITEESPEIENM